LSICTAGYAVASIGPNPHDESGAFTVWRKTAKKRMVAKLHAIKAELRLRMHEPVAEVGAWLRKVVTGYH